MKCQVNKKNNTRCDKESAIVVDDIHMCTQHHKTLLKNNIHQYGTCLDKEINYRNLSIKEYLFSNKVSVNNLDD